MTKCLLNTKSHDNTQRARQNEFFVSLIPKMIKEKKMSGLRMKITSKIRFDECKLCICIPGENVIGHLFQSKVLFSIFYYHQKWITSRSTLALPMNFPSTLLFLFLFAKVSFNSFGLSSIFRFATFRRPLPLLQQLHFALLVFFSCVWIRSGGIPMCDARVKIDPLFLLLYTFW